MKIDKETRNTLIVAAGVIVLMLSAAVYEESAIILGTIFGGLLGFIKGFTWLTKKKEVKPNE